MDSVITLADLTLPTGVEAIGDDEMTIVTVLTMSTPVLDAEDAAAAEADEFEGDEVEGDAEPSDAESDDE
ncbi:MAG: hypothetical protein CSA55_00155 [Ilumatobacter coccineus]|uniref:50S ribosomal protein L25 n=1 Tax=Ilumatobacter coccineus TaxID=467094 RepID=A0A2G6KGN4_9ACTN|nr:MAG: hypothetical protein CSA55_00155 [Ilumatobacter coccineus]